MTNRPKNIGTAAETAVVRFARENGFPFAERLALSGANDQGDIRLCEARRGPIIVEVKAHKSFSDGDVARWMSETEREVVNAGAHDGFLVIKRPGKGDAQVAYWWAVYRAYGCIRYMYLGDFLRRLTELGFGASTRERHLHLLEELRSELTHVVCSPQPPTEHEGTLQ